MQKIGEAMQAKASAEPHSNTPPPGTAGGRQADKPDIEEAEVEILDEEDKTK
jgi:hypothetical protein